MKKPEPEEVGESSKIYEFEATLKKLESEEAVGHELITLYIPPDKNFSEVTEYLKDEYTKTELINDKETRTHTQKTISSILSNLKKYEHLPPHGLAVFCGKNLTDIDGTDLPCTVIEPPESLNIYLYRCASNYDVEPLKQMLGIMNVYGLITIDVREAYWGFLRGDHVEFKGSATANVSSKQKKGGQSAPRFQRGRQIAINEFFARVGEHASTVFLSERDYFKRFRGVLIGGQTPTRENFLEGDYLNHEVQQRVIGLVEVARTDKAALWELADKAHEIIKGTDTENQKILINRFFKDLENNGGFAVQGEESVRKNLAAGAVGTLLLSGSLRKNRFHVTCQECGHGEERTFDLEPGSGIKDILIHTCRVCTDPVLENENIDITEELTHMADHTHANTVIISDDYEEGSTFLSSYGGIGAILRYKTV